MNELTLREIRLKLGMTIREMAEDGMTFLGVMECIFANKKPDSYDLGATKDWLPMSQEFKDWVGYANNMAQMEIAVYMIYGVRKE